MSFRDHPYADKGNVRDTGGPHLKTKNLAGYKTLWDSLGNFVFAPGGFTLDHSCFLSILPDPDFCFVNSNEPNVKIPTPH